MIRITMIALLLFAALRAASAEAASEKPWLASCGGFHFVRTHFSPPEIYVTSIGVRNSNVEGTVTIERLIVRDTLGNVLSESEPAVGVAHPENTDYPVGSPARDFTTVPAGQARYIRTLHFPWGLNAVPGPAGVGNFLTIEVTLSTDGKRDLVTVTSSRSSRERQGAGTSTSPFFETAEHSRDSSTCIRVD